MLKVDSNFDDILKKMSETNEDLSCNINKLENKIGEFKRKYDIVSLKQEDSNKKTIISFNNISVFFNSLIEDISSLKKMDGFYFKLSFINKILYNLLLF
jgi:phage shock protein A